jgi:sugar O-acyltransferase (sialic acid O-acetyltransferase NeuD family)
MSKIVVFGIKDFAELAHYYLSTDSAHEVVAFSVHAAYLPPDKSFRGLPVVPFETVESLYPPSSHDFFAPMSPKNMNRDRKGVYDAVKAKGYRCISYISTRATTFRNEIGENCFILENNTLQPFTSIGNNVVLWSGNHLGHHGRIRDHVMFTSHVVMSGHCDIGEYSFLGVNAALMEGLTLAEGTFVQMGTVLMKDTEAWGVYRGNPAEKLKFSSTKIKL